MIKLQKSRQTNIFSFFCTPPEKYRQTSKNAVTTFHLHYFQKFRIYFCGRVDFDVNHKTIKICTLTTVIYLFPIFVNSERYDMQMFTLDVGVFQYDIGLIAVTEFLHVVLGDFQQFCV